MKIGQVIRQYRKEKNMTQEEMANRLGVTGPAVNKWEKGNSQPDIMLLAPIARLLNISLDTLLSFEEELSQKEINSIVRKMDIKLKTESYEEVFQWAKKRIEEHPNCEQLIWQIALILDANCLIKEVPDAEKYETYINNCYVSLLDSKDENIRIRAADSLFGFYLKKEDYEKAEGYLHYFSSQNPERKRKQAFIYGKTKRTNQAYKAYEELLFSGYNMLSMVFQNIFILAMKDKDKEKAHKLVEKQSQLANVFEMGEYHELSWKLDLLAVEKDVEGTIETMEKMLASLDTLSDSSKSSLYEHMEFKTLDDEFIGELYESLLLSFSDQETFSYMTGHRGWIELIKGNKPRL